MKMSTIVAAHDRLGNRLHVAQPWDHLADNATVMLLMISGLQAVIERAMEHSATPDLVVASTAIQAADRDLQWLRDQGAHAPTANSHQRLLTAWHNIAHAVSALSRHAQVTTIDVA